MQIEDKKLVIENLDDRDEKSLNIKMALEKMYFYNNTFHNSGKDVQFMDKEFYLILKEYQEGTLDVRMLELEKIIEDYIGEIIYNEHAIPLKIIHSVFKDETQKSIYTTSAFSYTKHPISKHSKSRKN